MRVQQGFQNVFSYAYGVEKWVDDQLFNGPLEYTFVSDFAIADWTEGSKGVNETYERVKKSWLDDYKAFTEVVVALNMLSWANYALCKQGYEGRDEFIKLYSELYYRSREDFYSKYKNNEEACDHFFQMTD